MTEKEALRLAKESNWNFFPYKFKMSGKVKKTYWVCRGPNVCGVATTKVGAFLDAQRRQEGKFNRWSRS